MLGRRLAEPVKVVSILDPGLKDKLTTSELMRYAMTRDFSIVEKSGVLLDTLTVFEVYPLSVDAETFTAFPEIIFQMHLKSVTGVSSDQNQFVTKNGKKMLTDEALALYPRDAVHEIANVIVQSATRDGNALPFSPPDGWQEVILLRSKLSAITARSINSASETSSN